MQLEYFQLIDRITDLTLVKQTITVEAQVPQHNTIFEGHFPGYPIMPGVLLIESMAQTSGWLLLALMKFKRKSALAASCGPTRRSPSVMSPSPIRICADTWMPWLGASVFRRLLSHEPVEVEFGGSVDHRHRS